MIKFIFKNMVAIAVVLVIMLVISNLMGMNLATYFTTRVLKALKLLFIK